MTALLKVVDLSQRIYVYNDWFRMRRVDTLKSINLELEKGKTLALIGESSSGKSSLARSLAGLIKPTKGEIFVNGEALTYGDYERRCRLIRMIFQDPNTSLNPKVSVGRILETPLVLNTFLTESERIERVKGTLRMVGLLDDHASFYPQMLSSGQKQRVAIARALILNPRIIVADESISALDVSVRSQIVNLLLEMQETFELSYVIVSNDLGLVSHISDQVAVMQEGQIVEYCDTQELFANPQHELSKRLINAYHTEFKK
jgi:cationic peptide transport system ATP-binding protein